MNWWVRGEKPPHQADLNHIAVEHPDGDCWIVGYQVPGTTFVNVLCDGLTEAAAKSEARRLNFPRSKPVRQGWTPDRAVHAPPGL